MSEALQRAATKARRLAHGQNVDAYRDAIEDVGRAYLEAYPSKSHQSVTAPASLTSYHRDDEGQGAVDAYSSLLARLDEAGRKKLVNEIAHGAKATLAADGAVILSRKDWSSIKLLRPAAQPEATAPVNKVSKEDLASVLREGLTGTLHCGRVWSAWRDGTMSEADFSPVEESETPESLADAVMALLKGQQQAGVGEGEANPQTTSDAALRMTEAQIDQYVDEYVMEGDEGAYTPTERERFILKDAMMGLTAELAQAQPAAVLAWICAEPDGNESDGSYGGVRRYAELGSERPDFGVTPLIAQTAAAVPAPAVPSKEALAQVLRDGLVGTLHCGRVWSAWQVGTMTEDDFSPVDESDTPEELADAVLAFLAVSPADPQQPTGESA